MNKGLTFQAPRRAQGEPDKKMFELSKSNCRMVKLRDGHLASLFDLNLSK